MNVNQIIDRALLGSKLANVAGRGLQMRPAPYAAAAPAINTAAAPGRGLGYRPLSAGRAAFAGGLQGLSSLLAALAAGRPEEAAAAFQGGMQGFDEQQQRQADRARQDQLYDLEIEDRYTQRADKQAEKDAAAAEKSAYDAAIDQLAEAGLIDPAEVPAMKAGVAKYERPKAETFKPDLTSFGKDGVSHSGYFDQSGNWVEMGSTPQWEPDDGPAPTETERLLQLAGIDPNSPEGKAIITNKLQGDKGGGPKVATPKELRDEYTKANKDYEQALYGYGKVVNAAKNPSPAGDIALIFGFMKTMDPGSTVREGEFATAQNAGSVPERIVALYNSVLEGTRLTAQQRADFISQAQGQFAVYQQRKQVADQFYSGLAERSGVSPQDVLVPYGAVPQYTPGRGGPGDERNRGSRVIDGVRIERLQ